MRRVLVLRPEPGATATLERAHKLGLEAIALPLFEVESLSWAPPEPGEFDGLLLTSANAVRFGGEGLQRFRSLPVHAVGNGTAEEARTAGFEVAVTGNAGVQQLLQSIAPELKLLHLCGVDRKEVAAHQKVAAIPVYRSKTKEGVDMRAAQGGIALIHSPRAGTRFAELVSERVSISIVAISPTAAEAVGDGWAVVETAETPTDDGLLALAARLCNISDAQ